MAPTTCDCSNCHPDQTFRERVAMATLILRSRLHLDAESLHEMDRLVEFVAEGDENTYKRDDLEEVATFEFNARRAHNPRMLVRFAVVVIPVTATLWTAEIMCELGGAGSVEFASVAARHDSEVVDILTEAQAFLADNWPLNSERPCVLDENVN